MKQKGKMSGKKMKQMLVTYTFVLPEGVSQSLCKPSN